MALRGSLRPREGALLLACLLVIAFGVNYGNGACLGVAQCDCEARPGGDPPIINCRNRQLTNLPRFNSDSTLYSELTLAGNSIQTIGDNSFDGLNIQRLDLSGNPISTVTKNAFYGIAPFLKELLISLGPNANFPTDSLTGLSSLVLFEVSNYTRASLPAGALLQLSALVELHFVNCGLSSLAVNDFVSQRARLETLSLSGSRFNLVPTEALKSLPSLRDLDLSANLLTSLPANAFANFPSLASLVLNTNALENNINANAFVDVTITLKSLSCLSCRLGDRSLEAIRPLDQLTILNLPQNSIANIPNDLFKNMKSLHTIVLESNRITSLNRVMFQNLSNSLVLLNLRDNPLTNIAPDTFSQLSRLEDLTLTGVNSFTLTRDTFQHTPALRNLTLERTGVGNSVWDAIGRLVYLQRLVLASTSISQVPDYAFQFNNRLDTIDLSSNTISSIGQLTFVGLENSLNSINLNNNRLTSLDHCTFYQFQYFDYSRLGLNGNSLQCDCKLLWLFQKAADTINRTNPFKFSSLKWTCSSGQLFVQKTEASFGCNGVTESPCTPTTRSTPTPLTLYVTNQTEVSLRAAWTVDPSAESAITKFTITYHPAADDVNVMTATVSGDVREFEMTQLKPSTAYEVCVTMDAGADWTGQNRDCKTSNTMASPTRQSDDLNVVGIAVGSTVGGIALIAALVVGIVFFSRHTRKKEEEKARQLKRESATTFASFAAANRRPEPEAPQMGQGSKRYTRNKESKQLYYNSGTPGSTMSDNRGFMNDSGRPSTTRSFSQEETDKILALLTAVRASSASSIDPRYTTKPYNNVPGHQNNAYMNDDRRPSTTGNHHYDVIPGEAEPTYYNEPLDSVV